VSLDILLYLKKKVRDGCAFSGADMQKPYAPNYGQQKTQIDLFRDFLQKSPMSKLRILFQLKFPHCTDLSPVDWMYCCVSCVQNY
jgi:hypothetical protein